MAIEDNKEITAEDLKSLITDIETSDKSLNNSISALNKELTDLSTDLTKELTDLSTELTNFKNSYLNTIYPVGSIYVSVNKTNPSTLFGGTWTQIKDTFLLSAGSSYTAGKTGGSATVTLSEAQLPSHTHSGGTTSTAGEHTHTRGTMNITGTFHHGSTGSQSTVADGAFYINTSTTYNGDDNNSKSTGYQTVFDASRNWSGSTSQSGSHTHTLTLSSSGSGQAHDNMPPYLVVYMWKRTA